MEKVWLLRNNNIDKKKLAKEADVSEIIACLLANRGITDKDGAKKFLKASLLDMHNPLLMKDMDKGTEIIKNAILQGKKIIIYGDYDADGVMSTVILYKALLRCGASVSYYIPDREKEGYGMCSERISILKEKGCEVILTCDNGISASDEIEYAKEIGITTVVTDHHELAFTEENGIKKYIVPDADAVIDPKQKDCPYPFKSLCGAGIAYKFSGVLYKKMGINEDEAIEFIEYAGIGTICDIVDLTDENRIIAKKALDMLSQSTDTGIRALKKVLGIENKKINTYNVGFQIGPCINAAGRISTAQIAAELFMCSDFEKAYERAEKLNELNKKRQDMTTKGVEEIVSEIEKSPVKNDKVIVVYNENINESIAGIAAGRIKDMYNLPAIVITSGKDICKGSGRSIKQYNLFEELLKCRDLLGKFGGHPMAAGLSIKKENIDKLRKRLNDNCTLKKEDMMPKIRIDRRLGFNEISENLIADIEKLGPFGKGNPAPVFAEKNVFIEKYDYAGKDKSTVKLSLRSNNNTIEAVCFKKCEEFDALIAQHNYINKDKAIDIIYYPYINNYNGYKSIQINVSEFRVSS